MVLLALHYSIPSNAAGNQDRTHQTDGAFLILCQSKLALQGQREKPILRERIQQELCTLGMPGAGHTESLWPKAAEQILMKSCEVPFLSISILRDVLEQQFQLVEMF